MEKTALITGGAGFIGSHLVERLLSLHYKVICIDNLITGTKNNIEAYVSDPHFTFLHQDVLVDLPKFDSISEIYHLASPASVIDYQKYPKETALVNSLGTMKMLDLAHKYNAKFLFTSTSEVYGDPLIHPQSETYWGNVNPNGLRSCYDESKRFGEMMTMLYYRKYNTNIRIVRIFNTYGPRMRATDGRVISNFINQAISNSPITLYGDGSQTRSFCYITDLVDGIICAMQNIHTNGEVINLGNPEEYTMKALAQLIRTMTSSKSEIQYLTLPADDPKERKPDISKAKQILSWTPVVLLKIGLTKQ
jgi:nucleoside-diphosphate-sugar epimerase